MKRTTLSPLLLALLLTLASAPSQAQSPNPPGQFSYQGFLTDATGLPLATNNPVNYTVNFRIYNAAVSGTLLWAEQQVVTVDRGYFTVMLGNGTSVPGAPNSADLTSLFAGTNAVPADASDRYLEMTVTDLGSNPIAPRLRLLPSPYAYLASTALNVSATGHVPDTSLSTNVALRAGGNTFSGSQFVTGGTVGIGTTNTGPNALQINPTFETATGYALVACKSDFGENIQINRTAGQGGIGLIVDDAVAGDASTTMLAVRNNVNSSSQYLFDILANGNVGIGTASPTYPLCFPSSVGDKIALYPSGGNTSFGFGMQSFQLQIHTDTSAADVVFGYGSSASLTETMRITGAGALVLPNMETIQGRNAGGVPENFLWPRWSDNASYLNYGAGGFYIRNNSSAVTMYMKTNGFVGIGNSSPVRLLTVGGGASTVDGLISIGSGNGSSGRTWEVGVPYGTNNTSGDYYSFVVRDTGGYGDRIVVNWSSGFVGIGTNQPQQALHVVGNILATGTVNGSSDRNAKENFATVDPADVLDKVAALPISRWNYKDDREETHLGPMAQDFYAAFGLGMDEKHISMVDADGVALAAIQGLNHKLEQKEAEITDLKSRLEKLERLVSHESSDRAR